MRKILLWLILICVFNYGAAGVAACINSYETTTDLNGKSVNSERPPALEYIKQLVSHKDRDYWLKKKQELEQKRAGKQEFKLDVDYSAALLHLGEIKEAIAILEQVEKSHPGEFRVAGNLGTAYELNGENDKALEWIKEEIKRNEEAHDRTEWLHVKILEAKIALAKDPNWLKTHTVLGIDFGQERQPQQPNTTVTDFLGKQLSLEQVENGLYYQLHERLEFVRRPDAIVANLLFNLGDIIALGGSVEHAKELYKLSLNYNPTEKRLVEKRLSYAGYIILAGTYSRHPYIMILIGISTFAILGFIGYLIFRK